MALLKSHDSNRFGKIPKLIAVRQAAVSRQLGSVNPRPGLPVAGEPGPVITMSGEADIASAGQLREVLTSQLATGALYLTIDAAGLSFADSAAVSVLIETAEHLNDLGGGLVLLHPQSNIVRVLSILGADQVITIRAPIDTA